MVIVFPKTGDFLAITKQPSIVISIMPAHILGFIFLLNIFFFCAFHHVLARPSYFPHNDPIRQPVRVTALEKSVRRKMFSCASQQQLSLPLDFHIACSMYVQYVLHLKHFPGTLKRKDV